MASLTETQLNMLEQMFPRHVLEFMVAGANAVSATGTDDAGAAAPFSKASSSHLARTHEGVTIMFMVRFSMGTRTGGRRVVSVSRSSPAGLQGLLTTMIPMGCKPGRSNVETHMFMNRCPSAARNLAFLTACTDVACA